MSVTSFWREKGGLKVGGGVLITIAFIIGLYWREFDVGLIKSAHTIDGVVPYCFLFSGARWFLFFFFF